MRNSFIKTWEMSFSVQVLTSGSRLALAEPCTEVIPTKRLKWVIDFPLKSSHCISWHIRSRQLYFYFFKCCSPTSSHPYKQTKLWGASSSFLTMSGSIWPVAAHIFINCCLLRFFNNLMQLFPLAALHAASALASRLWLTSHVPQLNPYQHFLRLRLK